MLFSITFLQFDTLFYLCFNLNMREFDLKNNIRACVRENKNTPRVALTLNFSISVPEKYSGEYSLMNRLLLKGTENIHPKNYLQFLMKMQLISVRK